MGIATTTSALGVVLVFAMRYGMRSLPFIARKVWATRQKRAAQAASYMPKPPITSYSTTGVRH